MNIINYEQYTQLFKYCTYFIFKIRLIYDLNQLPRSIFNYVTIPNWYTAFQNPFYKWLFINRGSDELINYLVKVVKRKRIINNIIKSLGTFFFFASLRNVYI